MADTPHTVTEEAVANDALALLESTPAQPVRLAWLGQQMNYRLGVSIRSILGTKRLSQLLTEHFGTKLSFSGEGPELAVALGSSGNFTWDPAIWAAFSKPVPDGHKRWVKATHPMRFEDLPTDQQGPTGFLPVPNDDIPDPVLEKDQRRPLIQNAISAWCSEHMLNPEVLGRKSKRSTSELEVDHKATASTAQAKGTAALLALIDAIPADERRSYSLPIDLIGRLLRP